jgi:hypothetical protein
MGLFALRVILKFATQRATFMASREEAWSHYVAAAVPPTSHFAMRRTKGISTILQKLLISRPRKSEPAAE